MDEEAFFERLDSTADTESGLFEHFEAREAAGRVYHALSDARHGVERGTVLFPDADVVVRGYPSIPRVLWLETGVPSFFEGRERVVVEEKLDGFNVRIAAIDGDVLAFTRGGYVCPYTTGRARDLLDVDAFFDAHPSRMLCAELVGSETPYTTHDYADVDGHEIRVFGVRDRESGDPLPVDERRELCETFAFPQPELFGRYDPPAAADAVADVVSTLDDRGREGVVMKSPDCRALVKYTTASHHHDSLAYAFSLPFDYGRDFVFSRIVREAFQSAELDDRARERRERAHDLGESILLSMVDAIEAVADGETLGDDHAVRGDPDRIDALLDHLRNQGLALTVDADDREDGDRVVEFTKISESSTDRIQYYLDGGTIDE
jgi:putative ATP-dependent DNA ligase